MRSQVAFKTVLVVAHCVDNGGLLVLMPKHAQELPRLVHFVLKGDGVVFVLWMRGDLLCIDDVPVQDDVRGLVVLGVCQSQSQCALIVIRNVNVRQDQAADRLHSFLRYLVQAHILRLSTHDEPRNLTAHDAAHAPLRHT